MSHVPYSPTQPAFNNYHHHPQYEEYDPLIPASTPQMFPAYGTNAASNLFALNNNHSNSSQYHSTCQIAPPSVPQHTTTWNSSTPVTVPNPPNLAIQQQQQQYDYQRQQHPRPFARMSSSRRNSVNNNNINNSNINNNNINNNNNHHHHNTTPQPPALVPDPYMAHYLDGINNNVQISHDVHNDPVNIDFAHSNDSFVHHNHNQPPMNNNNNNLSQPYSSSQMLFPEKSHQSKPTSFAPSIPKPSQSSQFFTNLRSKPPPSTNRKPICVPISQLSAAVQPQPEQNEHNKLDVSPALRSSSGSSGTSSYGMPTHVPSVPSRSPTPQTPTSLYEQTSPPTTPRTPSKISTSTPCHKTNDNKKAVSPMGPRLLSPPPSPSQFAHNDDDDNDDNDDNDNNNFTSGFQNYESQPTQLSPSPSRSVSPLPPPSSPPSQGAMTHIEKSYQMSSPSSPPPPPKRTSDLVAERRLATTGTEGNKKHGAVNKNSLDESGDGCNNKLSPEAQQQQLSTPGLKSEKQCFTTGLRSSLSPPPPPRDTSDLLAERGFVSSKNGDTDIIVMNNKVKMESPSLSKYKHDEINNKNAEVTALPTSEKPVSSSFISSPVNSHDEINLNKPLTPHKVNQSDENNAPNVSVVTKQEQLALSSPLPLSPVNQKGLFRTGLRSAPLVSSPPPPPKDAMDLVAERHALNPLTNSSADNNATIVKDTQISSETVATNHKSSSKIPPQSNSNPAGHSSVHCNTTELQSSPPSPSPPPPPPTPPTPTPVASSRDLSTVLTDKITLIASANSSTTQKQQQHQNQSPTKRSPIPSPRRPISKSWKKSDLNTLTILPGTRKSAPVRVSNRTRKATHKLSLPNSSDDDNNNTQELHTQPQKQRRSPRLVRKSPRLQTVQRANKPKNGSDPMEDEIQTQTPPSLRRSKRRLSTPSSTSKKIDDSSCDESDDERSNANVTLNAKNNKKNVKTTAKNRTSKKKAPNVQDILRSIAEEAKKKAETGEIDDEGLARLTCPDPTDSEAESGAEVEVEKQENITSSKRRMSSSKNQHDDYEDDEDDFESPKPWGRAKRKTNKRQSSTTRSKKSGGVKRKLVNDPCSDDENDDDFEVGNGSARRTRRSKSSSTTGAATGKRRGRPPLSASKRTKQKTLNLDSENGNATDDEMDIDLNDTTFDFERVQTSAFKRRRLAMRKENAKNVDFVDEEDNINDNDNSDDGDDVWKSSDGKDEDGGSHDDSGSPVTNKRRPGESRLEWLARKAREKKERFRVKIVIPPPSAAPSSNNRAIPERNGGDGNGAGPSNAPAKRRGRKKKEFPERMFTMLESDELGTIRRAFEDFYTPPPSNLQAQASFELKYGRAMTPAMIQGHWQNTLKPWSDRWWLLYGQFNELAREKKLAKPRHLNPTLRDAEVKRWAKQFYKKNGPGNPKDLEKEEEQ